MPNYAKTIEEKTLIDFLDDYEIEDLLNKEDQELLLSKVHFEYSFDLHDKYMRIYLHGRKIENNNIVMKYVIMVNENRIYIEYDALNTIALKEFAHRDELNKFMVYYLLKNTDLRNDCVKHFEGIFYRQRNASKAEFEKRIDSLIQKIDTQEIINVTSSVHLLPLLTNMNGEYYLSLKIGREKEYIITKISDFIYRVKKDVTYRYGKDLEFIHSMSIFDEKSRRLIQLVDEYCLIHPLNAGRELKISSKEVKELFEIYQDSYLSINGRPYFIRLDKINTPIRIDENYLLHPIMPNDYVKLNKTRYLMDENKRIVDIQNGDRIYAALFEFALTSTYPSIEDKLDDFKYNFILRYPDFFELDPSIKGEFEFAQMEINAYFDFEKDSISLKVDLIVEGEKKTVNQLNKFNLLQLNRFNQIVNAYGFNDNQLKDQNLIWNFLSSDYAELKKIANVYFSENIKNKNLTSFKSPEIRINFENNLLDVFLSDSLYSDEELMAILSAIKQKKKYVLIKDNLINIDNANASRFFEETNNFNLDNKHLNTHKKLPLFYAFKTLSDNSSVKYDDEVKSILSYIKDFKKHDVDISMINADIRPYQVEGIKWLNSLYHYHLSGILADDMGLGKTLEIISFIANIKENKPILIVSPKSLLFNWRNEFLKFYPEQKVVLIYGDKEKRINLINSIKNNEKVVYITGYESLRIDEELYQDKSFEVLVLDEGQAIKNSQAQKSISVSHIQSSCRFVLTGTPIENSVLDLWSLFNFLMPNYFPEINEFKFSYESDTKYQEVIKKKIAPFILRRNKKDVLKDLPPKYDVLINCDMSSEQRKLYDAYRLKAKTLLRDNKKAFDVLPILMRLRQICITPSLFVENYESDSGKLTMLEQVVLNRIENGHRILIFSQFVKALEAVSEILNKNNIDYRVINGDTKAEDRVSLSNEFNTNRRIKIMLVSLKAGGNGLNLIGADTIIHLDPWWNVASQDQATDRAHRIGQERNVEVIKLICENSIEERVVEMQNKKKELSEKLISENDSSITSMALDDISYLLE